MSPTLRQTEILTMVRRDGQVQVDDLAQQLKVTVQTVRRDLNTLSAEGHVLRIHGGAVMPSGVISLGYEDRRALAMAEKAAMADLCAHQITEGGSLFMNIGTTVEAVARALLHHRNLMVVTNNLNVANILSSNPNIEVVVAGGVLRRADAALVGEVTAEFVAQFKVDHAIIGASAIDDDGALLDFDYREVKVAQAIIRNARRTTLVADASKFARAAPVRIASMTDIDTFVTDRKPPKSIRRLCRANDVEIHLAH